MNALIVFVISLFLFSSPHETFRQQQMKFQRVKTAYTEKEKTIRDLLKSKGVDADNFSMLIRVFKLEHQLEVWAKSGGDKSYTLIQTYPVCASSGKLGPKRRAGDSQVPEGFYYINRFNPSSSFYLSLGINYPNESDRILSDKTNPGGDIFIHGSCVTIGCMPMTDDKIKEIYLFAVEARTHGQTKIPVYIFPTAMDDAGIKNLERVAIGDTSRMSFWKNLSEGFQIFQRDKKVIPFSVDKTGKYIFSD